MRDDDELNVGKIVRRVLFGIVALVALTTLLGSWYTVDQGERGVILCNGAVCGEAEPGLHFKTPFVQSVEYISVQSQKSTYGDVKTYSLDQQPATLRVSINWHVADARATYEEYKSADNMIARAVQPQVYTWSENTFGRYNAVEAVQERAKLNADLATAVRKVVKGPIVIESIQIENIDFSDKYEKAVEDRMEAGVKQQQALSEAAATKTRAEAKAYSTKVQGDAEASAIRARGDALKENPGIPALVAAEKWNGILPTTMVPGQTVPFLSLHGAQQ